jgi:hypothetical protein
MTGSIDHIVRKIIKTRLNFISLEMVENSAYVGQETNKIEQKEGPHRTYSKLLKKKT